jgi:uncharacterized membrane protein (Fun14 family)
MTPSFQHGPPTARAWFRAVLEDGPWRAKTVLAALVAVLIGMGFWVKGALDDQRPQSASAGVKASSNANPAARVGFSRPIPGYVRAGVSYIGGFLLGWTFRRFVKLAALATLVIVGILGFARFVGCDSSSLRERVEHEAAAVKETAKRERDYLKGLLPSATAGGIGVFLGFRRKSRLSVAAPAPNA